jgi:hypothetical protein
VYIIFHFFVDVPPPCFLSTDWKECLKICFHPFMICRLKLLLLSRSVYSSQIISSLLPDSSPSPACLWPQSNPSWRGRTIAKLRRLRIETSVDMQYLRSLILKQSSFPFPILSSSSSSTTTLFFLRNHSLLYLILLLLLQLKCNQLIRNPIRFINCFLYWRGNNITNLALLAFLVISFVT